MKEVGIRQVVHHQVAPAVFELEKECLVSENVRVLKCLHLHKILLKEQEMLPFQIHGFNCEHLFSFFVEAFLDYSVSTLSSLLTQAVFVVEERLRIVFVFVF